MTTAIASGGRQDPAAINAAANAGPPTVSYEMATLGSTTSVTYTATITGSSVAGGTFVCPPSGRVMVLWGTGMFHNTLGSSGWCSWEIRAGASVGSGTVVVAADDSRAVRMKVAHATNNDQQWGWHYPVLSGLTASSTYNIRHMFKNEGSGTLSIVRQRITVTPAH